MAATTILKMATSNNTAECIFCKIIEGGLPAYKVYEDNNTLAFLDIFPIHPGHVLVIPKSHFTDIFDTPEKDLQNMMAAAKKLSPAVMKAAKADAINIGMNNKPASGQVVMHAHLHIIPRYKTDGLKTWPQKPYGNDAEKEQIRDKIKSVLYSKI